MRRRLRHSSVLTVLLAAFLLAGCVAAGTQPTETTEPPQAFELILLHTNDVRGFTEPCG